MLGSKFDLAPDGKRFLVGAPMMSNADARINYVLNWFDELRRLAPPKK